MGGKSGGADSGQPHIVKQEPSDLMKPKIESALRLADRRYAQRSNPLTNPMLAERIAPPQLVTENYANMSNPYLAPPLGSPNAAGYLDIMRGAPGATATPANNTVGNMLMDILRPGS
jgi:hypothetical protein